jgi:NADPH:quinone reductase
VRAVGSYAGLPIVDPMSLVDVDLLIPELGQRAVLVAVRAVSVNPADVKRRAGLTSAATPIGLGPGC